MCGITGVWGGAVSLDRLSAVTARMACSFAHRGPDDQGVWVDATAGLALGHRRLSILDLTEDGHQPMLSADGRYVIVFNGEVYNHAEIRRELAAGASAPTFRGHSDTEVMLAAIERWGLHAAVRRFVGMFAFGLWDRRSRTLHLVRDRVGIKPLYYGRVADALCFASELRAFEEHPGFVGEVDRDAVALLMRRNCIPAPFSVYRGIRKMLPGQILTWRSPEAEPEVERYWSAGDVVAYGVENPFEGSDTDAADRLEALLGEAVAMRMIADVPLGAFLSGGVDSSAVVALMQAHSPRPVRTFSIGFHDSGMNEAADAHRVASFLGTDHTELYVSPREAMEVIPRLPTIYDEPFADSSQIPTFLVSQLARGDVTVALSGDGGDEIFAGYNRHLWAPRVWKTNSMIPSPLRRGAASLLRAVKVSTWNDVWSRIDRLLPRALRHRSPGYKLHKLAELLSVDDAAGIYGHLTAHWKDSGLVQGGEGSAPPVEVPEVPLGMAERMMLLDLLTYLPDDILTKVDRASMAVSLEVRVPILDHRVVEFAWTLPHRMKVRDGRTKWLLRQVLYRHVPRELIERPKMGFGVPLGDWLRGPLRDWAEDLLDERRMRAEGYLDAGVVHARWREHLEGRGHWQYHVWDVLMFQAWLRSRSEHTSLASDAGAAA